MKTNESRKQTWVEHGNKLRLHAAYLRVHGNIVDAEKIELEATHAEALSRRHWPPYVSKHVKSKS